MVGELVKQHEATTADGQGDRVGGRQLGVGNAVRATGDINDMTGQGIAVEG